MKISELWLREWVNPTINTQQLSAQLTMAGLEVDAVAPVSGQFNNVFVARVKQTTAHPQADKLNICQVEIGDGALLQIVCGAKNVCAGLMVALALPGAKLPGGIEIKESVLRGEMSQGMLCSTTELGMSDESEGILELPSDAPLGMDLRDYLNLNDHILDLDLTPNRADCFSIIGVAREVAAINKVALNPIVEKQISVISDVAPVHVIVDAARACPQYCVRRIEGINPHAVTPMWMKERLRRAGIRSIHPVVDVTQYVMLEYGQPMHAFDAHAIDGHIHVRFANKDEKVELLDSQKITLNNDVLVIADKTSVLAMAGIMGGVASSVKDDTTDIILESAFFNPLSVAGIARRYGLCTDSSQRFERGVDPSLAPRAIERATELLLSIVGGKVGAVALYTQNEYMPASIYIQFNPALVKRLSGIELSFDAIQDLLERLGLVVNSTQDVNSWTILVPSHRFDLCLDVDLVEEVVRLYGYDQIPMNTSVINMQPGVMLERERLQIHLANFLAARGYQEAINYSFVDPELQEVIYPDADAIKLMNPLSQELSVMRSGMWSGLLAALIYNVHRQQQVVKFFEHGVVFKKIDNKFQESARLACLLSGKAGTLNWGETAHQFDFYDLKGDIQALFASLQCHDVQYKPDQHPALHPGKSAQLIINEQPVGWLGVLHPRLQEALDLTDEVILFEVDLVAFSHDYTISYKSVSKYPQTRRDLALLVPGEVNASQVESVIKKIAQPHGLKSVDIFDVYTGPSIPTTHKSLALALIFQKADKTLIDTEINALIDVILQTLAVELSITIRTE